MSDAPRPIDPDQVRALAAIHCTPEEMAAVLGCSVERLQAEFAEVIELGRLQAVVKLRQIEHQRAMAGDPASLRSLAEHWMAPHAGDDPPRPLSRADLKLLRHAARERWNVPDSVRNDVILSMVQILANPRSTNRDRIAASRTFAAFDRSDQREDTLEIRRGLPAEPETGTIDPAAAAAALRAAREMKEESSTDDTDQHRSD